jgi:hypothetical protein
MRFVLVIAAFAALAACSQETTTSQTETTTEAPAAPASTIAEADAISRAEAAGYTNIVDLAPNPDGSWSATGTKDGAAVQITITDAGAVPTVPLE